MILIDVASGEKQKIHHQMRLHDNLAISRSSGIFYVAEFAHGRTFSPSTCPVFFSAGQLWNQHLRLFTLRMPSFGFLPKSLLPFAHEFAAPNFPTLRKESAPHTAMMALTPYATSSPSRAAWSCSRTKMFTVNEKALVLEL